MEEFEYHVGDKESKEIILVPKGFITNFASVPRFFWSIIPPWGKYGKAAVIHDYLYYTKKYTRKRADEIFLEGMEVLGVSLWKRQVMYWAVRIFAKSYYGGDRLTKEPEKDIDEELTNDEDTEAGDDTFI